MDSCGSALRRWADLCTTDFAAFDPERAVAVWPLGATEQHGPHLPLDVDSAIVDGVLTQAGLHVSPDLPVYVLPTLALGLSPEHQAFAGTLTLRAETVLALWLDVGASVARAGVRKLLLFNGHGGHTGMMDVVARELRTRHGLLVYSCSWFNLPLHDETGQDLNRCFSGAEHRFGIHAGQIETSLMMALRPDAVRTGHAQDFASTSAQRAQRYPILGNGRTAKLAWQIQDYHPQGAVGNAAAADAALGSALLRAAGRSLAQMLQELSDLPLATLVSAPERRPH